MMTFSLHNQADALAGTIHELTQWNKSHPNAGRYAYALFRLPPVFMGESDSKTGNGRKNLAAMVKTLADYEEAPEGRILTLAELPARYNRYGGKPDLSERDLRKMHNWLQIVSFAVRAAMLDQEDCFQRAASRNQNKKKVDAATVVAHRLYGGAVKRTFVTYAPDSRYEMKPLRYASQEAIERWIREEQSQRTAYRRGENVQYGAQPSDVEWDAFGLRGQTRTLVAQIQTEIETLMREAAVCDCAGRYQEADILDARLKQMKRSLESLNREDVIV